VNVLTEKIERGIEHLYVFDMDDTLIKQVHRDDAEKYLGKPWPHERWWTRPESLRPPFPVKIKAPQKAAFVRAKQDPKGKVVVMTGRVATKDMKSTVGSLLTKLGYGPLKFGDNLFLKRLNVRDTAGWKKSMLTGFAKRFPDLKKISMWDDRAEHVRQFEAHIKKLGLEAAVTHVKGGQPYAVKAESYPNRPWWSIATGAQSKVPARRKLKTVDPVELPQDEPEEPMDNPLPGNMSPRAKQAVPGSDWHNRKRRPGNISMYGRRRLKSFFSKQGGWGR
jgi:hypothetical protein